MGVRLQGHAGWRKVEDVVQVKLKVVPAVVLRPAVVMLPKLRPGETRTVEVGLWGVRSVLEGVQAQALHPAVQVVSLQWQSPPATEPVPQALHGASQLLWGRLVLRIGAEAADPEVLAKVRFVGHQMAEVRLPELPVYVRVVRPWQAFPPRVYVRSEGPWPQRFPVLVRFEKPLALQDLAAQCPSGILVHLEPLDKHTVRVVLEVQGPLLRSQVVQLHTRGGEPLRVKLELVPDV